MLQDTDYRDTYAHICASLVGSDGLEQDWVLRILMVRYALKNSPFDLDAHELYWHARTPAQRRALLFLLAIPAHEAKADAFGDPDVADALALATRWALTDDKTARDALAAWNRTGRLPPRTSTAASFAFHVAHHARLFAQSVKEGREREAQEQLGNVMRMHILRVAANQRRARDLEPRRRWFSLTPIGDQLMWEKAESDRLKVLVYDQLLEGVIARRICDKYPKVFAA